MGRRRRQNDDKMEGGLDGAPKKLKTSHDTDAIVTPAVEKSKSSAVIQAPILNNDEGSRMKSKKELRKEKKALKNSVSATSVDVSSSQAQEPAVPAAPLSKEEEKIEKIRLRKERRKQFLAEQEIIQQQEVKEEKKLRKERKRNRVLNAPGGAKARNEKQKDVPKSTKKGEKKSAAKESSLQTQEHDIYEKILSKVLNGSEQDEDGTTTLRLGVKYKDVSVGTGPMVQEKNLVTVRYKLTGGRFGAVLDSSNKFTFRLGKGEVIQGWDIGMVGMCQGGTRTMTIPPKAGYGASDIGAGPGATLYFKVTVL